MQPIKNNNLWIFCPDQIRTSIEEAWFEQAFWLNQGRLLGANSGRGTAWVVKSEFGKWVLRHYYRGGMYAKINKDRYFWTGLHNTRAVKEYELLLHLQKLGLPSPNPIAAKVSKNGVFYRNDLLMEFINHDQTFAHALKQNNYDESIWSEIGAVIKQFHKNGIYHADLNTHNILLNKNNVFLIDFDKGKVRTPKASWQQANLNRLKRSIEKETNKSCDQELTTHWQKFLNAYHES